MTHEAQVKRVGFYESAEEVSALAETAPRAWETLALRYLQQGTTVLASPSWGRDLLDPRAGNTCQYAVLTDGTWVWPNDLAYYLRTYHVVLPEEFLDHMATCDWTVPALGKARLEAICDQL